MAINPLYDKLFLTELDKNREREIFARITLLTFDEQPIEYIEGKTTGGSVNIDGTSVLRRTCSLSMVSANLDINIFLLGLERKFKLEIGLKNNINTNYPEIIWFNQGIFVTTGVNTSRSTSNYSISISGKDKMCLLNGDVSGSLPSSIDFGMIEEYSEDGTQIVYKHLKLKDIIRNAVESYGNELPHNIIINDLEDSGFELLEYRGDTPLYVFKQEDRCVNVTLDQDVTVYLKSSGIPVKISSKDDIVYDSFVDLTEQAETPTEVYLENNNTKYYTIGKIENGEVIGYRETELTYAGELIGNIGDSLTSILDKIKNMLVNFEYFYDINGRFIFQKKKTYEDGAWTPEILNEDGETYFENNKLVSELFYSFEDNDLIISFNNSPELGNVKNDFSIWGVREGVAGGEIPIHLRYALEQKPTRYKTYYEEGVNTQWEFIAEKSPNKHAYEKDDVNHIVYCDWREVLYQMALDYTKFRDTKEDFYSQVENNNREADGWPAYPGGRTGYEQYYTDILGFWRSLYSPGGFYKQVLLSEGTYKAKKYYTKDENKADDKIGRFPTYTLAKSSTFYEDKIYYELSETDVVNIVKITDEKEIEIGFYTDNCYASNVLKNPTQINFWIDFLETSGELSKYAVRAIGQRPKNVNDSDITSIYYRKVPNLIFRKADDENKYVQKTAYTYIETTTALENCLVVSSQGKSAWEEMEAYLNENTFAKENVSITAIPIYHLEPNVKISIKDSQSKVNGEYLLSKITLPLAYNGTMSLSVSKVVDKIY